MCRVTQWFCSEEFLAQHNIQYEGRQGSVPVFAGSQPSAKLCRVGEAERRIAGSEPSAGTAGSLKGEFLAHSLVQVQVQEEGWMKMQVQERRGVSS